MILGALINHPELLSRETLYELRSIVACYPYFQAARLLMLNNLYLLHDPDFGNELRRSVLYVSDRRILCRLIEGSIDRVVPDDCDPMAEPSVDRAMDLIDAFLDTLPEEHGSSLVVDNAVSDYAACFLMGDNVSAAGNQHIALTEMPEDDSVDRALELISQPILHGTPQPQVEESDAVQTKSLSGGSALEDEELVDENYFTETLAKIYIKQRKYSRALEIIRSLYLQFPEKNAYFADQIRFLEKLIINNNSK